MAEPAKKKRRGFGFADNGQKQGTNPKKLMEAANESMQKATVVGRQAGTAQVAVVMHSRWPGVERAVLYERISTGDEGKIPQGLVARIWFGKNAVRERLVENNCETAAGVKDALV